MRFESWERLGLDRRKSLLLIGGMAGAFFVLFAAAGTVLRLGSVGFILGALATLSAGYLASTAPRRSVRGAAFLQTLEAPALAASSNIYIRTTSSRSKTLLMLRAEEKRLQSFLADVRRDILLGYDAASAARNARIGDRVFSESAKTVVDSVVGANVARVEEGGDELDGILNSSSLDEETRLPLFIAVSFFLPIMLMLFTAMTRTTGLAALAALVVLEVLILDLTLAVSESTVGWGKAGSS